LRGFFSEVSGAATGTAGSSLATSSRMRWLISDSGWVVTKGFPRLIELMTSLGSSGREAYVHFYLTFDFYFPALISSLMMISLLMLLLAHHRRLMILAYTPVIAYLCDFFENTTNLLISSSWPAQPVVLWTLGPVWTFCKWSAIFISLGLIAMAAVIRIGDIFVTRYNRTPGTARLG